jgi:hypothetical protein
MERERKRDKQEIHSMLFSAKLYKFLNKNMQLFLTFEQLAGRTSETKYGVTRKLATTI